MRARRCTGRVHDDCDRQTKKTLVQNKQPIHRVVYWCAEACCAVDDTSNDDNENITETDDDDSYSDADPSIGKGVRKRSLIKTSARSGPPQKKRKRSCRVSLHVRAYFIHGRYADMKHVFNSCCLD